MMPNVATIHCGPYCEAAAIKSLCEVARYEELCKEGIKKDTTRVFQVLQEGGAIDAVTHPVVTRSTRREMVQSM